MRHYPAPVREPENPCWCPEISAIAFLRSLRQPLGQKNNNTLRNKSRHSKSARFSRMLSHALPDVSSSDALTLIPSFNNRLIEALTEKDLLRLQRAADCTAVQKNLEFSSPGSGTSTYFASSPEKNSNKRIRLASSTKENIVLTRSDASDRAESRISHSTPFSGIRGPVKHERSSVSVNENSFELSSKADRLNFFPPGRKSRAKEWFSPYRSAARVRYQTGALTASDTRRKMRKLEDELYGPPIGTESPRGIQSLISRVDALLPGTRLKEKLLTLDALSHQRIADILSTDGSLNTRILNLLRMSEIECIDLTASMTDEEGLNLDARELLQVFAKPNSFLFLREINLSAAKLNDTDFKHIHHLPRLSRLWISNTGIGNEAIFLLVPLKRSLTELDVAFNAGITDDAIPALLILHRLRFLTLLNTGVDMPGLRMYCSAIRKRKHTMELEVPRECEIYVEKMGRQYILQLEAPLLSDPELVTELSTNALRKNLAAHAEHNPSIIAEGGKTEMAERLRRLLELRAADLGVREVLWKGEEEEEEDDSEVDERPDQMEVDEDITACE